ncbi:hypothetical protein COW94_04485 [Candidatus Peregrinibacteria bacterium CG22_combo_CG10-13_8_21_14_all_44_10]|nr:MAG: hypothetical protein COW94_04485 [Candidatus Peregrinibacteria bacterium CG22_combo_CG10-13_8_21_14_all_44_10]PIS04072.1 MAG: hypothetical protein COT83_02480 [Candidatus Peregrinibacteria bacterium CG10_big_fil_rev_8_21_14_0_10_44_7]PJB88369.1 MAG: hypothetical protein CO082_04910 [Candidatus Peregrinibacteria bacterium CG_4_9_14_0_8_um_filter_44_15]
MKNRISNLLKNSQKKLKSIRAKIDALSKIEEYEKTHNQKIESTLPKPKKQDTVLVHLSIASVAKSALVILLIYLLMQVAYEIRSIILIVFVSLLLYAAIDPAVNKLQSRKVPRAISVLGIYAVLLFLVGFFISNLIPIVADQLLELAKKAGHLITNITNGDSLETLPFADKIIPYLQSSLEAVDQQTFINNLQGTLEKLGEQLQNIAGNTFVALKMIFNGVFNAILVLIITFFLVVDAGSVDKFLKSVFPSKYSAYIVEKSEKIKDKIGHWIRGMMMLMISMFTLYLIGFSLLGLDFAITLAMMGGIAELFPVIGPILAGIPAGLIAFNESPWLVLWVIGIVIMAQQLEGNVLIPLIMKKAVGLKPVIIIISVLIGYQMLGILGIILAVPVATTASLFVTDYLDKEK